MTSTEIAGFFLAFLVIYVNLVAIIGHYVVTLFEPSGRDEYVSAAGLTAVAALPFLAIIMGLTGIVYLLV